MALSIILMCCHRSLFAQKENVDKIIAIVGDNIILRSDIEAAFEDYKKENPLIEDSYKCHILEQVVLQKVLIEQASRDSIIVSDEEIEGALNNRIRYFVSMYGSEEKLEEMAGKSVYQIKDEYRPMFRDKLIADRMQGQIMSGVKITPQEVKAFYEKIPKDSLPFYPSMVEAGHIVFKPGVNKEVEEDAIEKLKNIRKEIATGKSTFETMAGIHSEDPGSKDEGGNLGIMSRDELDPEFAAAAFKLQNGELSDVVKSSFGYHIIQMMNRQGEKAKLRHILVKPLVTKDQLRLALSLADSVRANLISGTMKFSEAIAKYHSDDATKYTGGMFSDQRNGSALLPVENLEPSVALLVNDLKPGEYSTPFEYTDERTGDKLVRIVFLKKRTEPHRANLEEDYALIQNAAFDEKRNNYLFKWLENKVHTFYMRIDQEYDGCEEVKNWQSKTTKK